MDLLFRPGGRVRSLNTITPSVCGCLIVWCECAASGKGDDFVDHHTQGVRVGECVVDGASAQVAGFLVCFEAGAGLTAAVPVSVARITHVAPPIVVRGVG